MGKAMFRGRGGSGGAKGCKEIEIRNDRDGIEGNTDLSRPRLRQIRYNVHLFRGCERSDDFPHLQRQLLGEPGFVTWVECEFTKNR